MHRITPPLDSQASATPLAAQFWEAEPPPARCPSHPAVRPCGTDRRRWTPSVQHRKLSYRCLIEHWKSVKACFAKKKQQPHAPEDKHILGIMTNMIQQTVSEVPITCPNDHLFLTVVAPRASGTTSTYVTGKKQQPLFHYDMAVGQN